VEDILPVLERKLALRCLDNAKALGNAGRAVEVADRLTFAAKCGVAGEKGWESLTRFAGRVSESTKHYFSGGFRHNATFPAGEFRQYVDEIHPTEIFKKQIDIDMGGEKPKNAKEISSQELFWKTKGQLLLRAEEVSYLSVHPALGLQNGMIATSGEVRLTSAFSSVIVAGDNVKIEKGLLHCILVCDGDVELQGLPDKHNLIIARGKVTCSAGKLRCMIRSGHTLQVFDGILFDGSRVAQTIDLRKDGKLDPLPFVKFFELADVGLTAEDLPRREKPDVEGVLLKDVRKDSPFAVRLCTGDVITSIEDKKTPTTEIFRRVLRRRRAEGGPAITFTVRRSGESRDVLIPLKD
jgi:hypothetical protein